MMQYQLSQTGLRAIRNSEFKHLSPNIHQALREINDQFEDQRSLSNDTHDMLHVLMDLGMVIRIKGLFKPEPLNRHDSGEMVNIKSDLVKLLKTDFNQDDSLWDMLLNIESIDDRNGMLWFMNRLMHMAPSAIRGNYKGLFQQLLEFKDE